MRHAAPALDTSGWVAQAVGAAGLMAQRVENANLAMIFMPSVMG